MINAVLDTICNYQKCVAPLSIFWDNRNTSLLQLNIGEGESSIIIPIIVSAQGDSS